MASNAAHTKCQGHSDRSELATRFAYAVLAQAALQLTCWLMLWDRKQGKRVALVKLSEKVLVDVSVPSSTKLARLWI